MSGNDRRRRASEMGLPALPIRIGSLSEVRPGNGRMGMTSSSNAALPGLSSLSLGTTEKRPERLIRLGQKLRESVAEKGIRA